LHTGIEPLCQTPESINPQETTMGDTATPPSPRDGDTSLLPTLVVTGELDLAVAPWLYEQLEALFVGGSTSIAVDLSGATFIDSTALGVLVGALNRCLDLGGQLHLTVNDPQILRVLRITGLTDTFTLHEGGAAHGGEGGN
jgi:anti-sigma B factor antagonist